MKNSKIHILFTLLLLIFVGTATSAARDRRATDKVPEDQVTFSLNASFSAKKVVVGQIFDYKLTLISNTPRITNINLRTKVQTPEGLIFLGTPEMQNYKVRHTADNRYEVDLLTRSYQATRTGTFTFPEVTYDIVWSTDDYYDDFFFGMFSRGEQYVTTLNSKTVKIKVDNLPKSAPADYSGAVGNFTFKCDYSDLNYNVGAEFLLPFTLMGTGNLDNVDIPDFRSAFGDGIKLISVDTSTYTYYTASGLNYKVVYECRVRTTENGNFVIQPVPFTYFDTATMKYTTISTNACRLNVGATRKQSEQKGEFVYSLPANHDNTSAPLGLSDLNI